MALPADSKLEVIVQYRHAPTAADHQRMSRRGGWLMGELTSIKAGVYTLPVSSLQDLELDNEIVHVSPNRTLAGMSDTISRGYDFTPQTVGESQAGIPATGIGIAVIDSGVTPNPDLTNSAGKSRIVYQESFVPGTTDATDFYGHGTHVAGTIAGNGAKSLGKQFIYNVTGMAVDANIVNLRVLDQNGAGTDAQVIGAIQRAISLRSSYNIRVINLSWGGRFLKATPWTLCARLSRRRGKREL